MAHMKFDTEKFSEKANDIISRKNKYWEHLLCIQLLDEELSMVKSALQDVRSLVQDSFFRFNSLLDKNCFPEILAFFQQNAIYYKGSNENFDIKYNPKNNAAAFGPPGKPGDHLKIKAYCQRYSAEYYDCRHRCIELKSMFCAIDCSLINLNNDYEKKSLIENLGDSCLDLIGLYEAQILFMEGFGPFIANTIETTKKGGVAETYTLSAIDKPHAVMRENIRHELKGLIFESESSNKNKPIIEINKFPIVKSMQTDREELPAEAQYLFEEAENYSFAWGKYPQNEKEAMRLLKKSASLGCIDAYIYMGELYSNGGPFDDSKFSGNYEKAIDCYIRAGSMGSIWSYYELALIYAGKFQDELNARKCFILCAEKIIEKENGLGNWLDSDKLETLTTFIVQSVPYALCGKRDEYNLSLFHNLFIEFSLVIADRVEKKYEEILGNYEKLMSESRYGELISELQCYKEYVKNQLPPDNCVATRQIHDAPQIETQTLPEVLAWLCTQNSVPLTVLRQKLLPLGLLPSALINDVNERAFEIAGEPALDEATDNVIVQRGLLLQVLAVW
jgi:hypothetical protein